MGTILNIFRLKSSYPYDHGVVLMKQDRDPWIVTDDRLPCLVLSGRVEPASAAQLLRCALNSSMTYISNVYNCGAFSLNRQCTLIFCADSDGQVAFISLEPDCNPSDKGDFQQWAKTFDEARHTITKVIRDNHLNCTLVIEKVALEITGRQLN
jgi:hypothetical protein